MPDDLARSGETPADRIPRASWAHVVFASLACLTGGGGVGSLATGANVSAKLEVTRAEIVGRLDLIAGQLDDLSDRLDDHEDRLRVLEKRTPQ